ncbi:hypothetical protein IE53DRAFT_28497 [Violaceomyces palustris]|uniref:Uncharacterized protein n=1 Tax=Violaceomyces palustris TaxID=1673888 RepID=A0ACD0NL80_9BASI|nr:hypothetical protein IE53DRAFT_28497 [Violaceomyces palustris]
MPLLKDTEIVTSACVCRRVGENLAHPLLASELYLLLTCRTPSLSLETQGKDRERKEMKAQPPSSSGVAPGIGLILVFFGGKGAWVGFELGGNRKGHERVRKVEER